MDMKSQHQIVLANVNDTIALGKQLAKRLNPGQLIFLQGDLGAGKTTLTRGILRGLGYEGNVKSPTFTLIEPYQFSDFNLYHVDLYRLEDAAELEALGFYDYINEESICLIEWAEKAKDYLPPANQIITINISDDIRKVTII